MADSKSKKSTKMAAISKLQVRITKYLMCIYGGHMCICTANMKFLCLTLWQREMCIDDDDANANANNARWTKHDCIKALWFINQMSQKCQLQMPQKI